MRFSAAIDLFIGDMKAQGRLNSPSSERSYRHALDAHAQDVNNRDPAKTGREDVKRTLRRWPKPNTQGTRRAVLVSFYDWAMEEGIRKDNPARQTRRPKRKPTQVYRLTRGEALALMQAARPGREQRVIHIGICAGLRAQELRGLQGRHFQRHGFIHVSADIAKGGRGRWVPIIADLEPLITEIRATVAPDEYVICMQRWRNPGVNTETIDYRKHPASPKAIWELVGRVAKRAGIQAHIHPHLMRHAFGDHIARYVGLKNAQALMGHATVDTTADTYTGKPTLDELVTAVRGFTFAAIDGYPPQEHRENPVEAPTGIEPVSADLRRHNGDSPDPGGDEGDIDPDIAAFFAPLDEQVALYREVYAR